MKIRTNAEDAHSKKNNKNFILFSDDQNPQLNWTGIETILFENT